MKARSLNLLRHPRREVALEPALLRACLIAGLVGALAGGLWSGWQHMRMAQLEEQRAQLQARWQVQNRQQTDAVAGHERGALHRQLLERATDWQGRRAQLLRLHQALNAQADDPGLRVERWQSDGRRQVLQAWLPRTDQVPQLMATLSAAWPQRWRLQSLGEHAGTHSDAGVDAVFETTWPVAGQGSRPVRP